MLAPVQHYDLFGTTYDKKRPAWTIGSLIFATRADLGRNQGWASIFTDTVASVTSYLTIARTVDPDTGAKSECDHSIPGAEKGLCP